MSARLTRDDIDEVTIVFVVLRWSCHLPMNNEGRMTVDVFESNVGISAGFGAQRLFILFQFRSFPNYKPGVVGSGNQMSSKQE